MTSENHKRKAQDQSLRDVLVNTSDYLKGLMATVNALEELLLMNLAQAHPFQAADINMQSVDFVTQSLEETVHLLERIAADLPSGLSINLDHTVAPIKLELFRDHVLTAQGKGLEVFNSREVADVELF